jgi:hypothetical protein
MGALLRVRVPPRVEHNERSEAQLRKGDRPWAAIACDGARSAWCEALAPRPQSFQPPGADPHAGWCGRGPARYLAAPISISERVTNVTAASWLLPACSAQSFPPRLQGLRLRPSPHWPCIFTRLPDTWANHVVNVLANTSIRRIHAGGACQFSIYRLLKMPECILVPMGNYGSKPCKMVTNSSISC